MTGVTCIVNTAAEPGHGPALVMKVERLFAAAGTSVGSVTISGCGRAKLLIVSGGLLRRRELEPFADKLDGLGQSRGTEAKRALDDAGLASNVTRDVEGRCLSLAERASPRSP